MIAGIQLHQERFRRKQPRLCALQGELMKGRSSRRRAAPDRAEQSINAVERQRLGAVRTVVLISLLFEEKRENAGPSAK